MSNRLFEFIVSGVCLAVIAASAVIGAWLLLITMGL